MFFSSVFPEEVSPTPTGPFTCGSGVLTRLLSLAGHVALRQLVHLDNSIFGELKRRRNLQEEQKDKEKKKGKKGGQDKAKVGLAPLS